MPSIEIVIECEIDL